MKPLDFFHDFELPGEWGDPQYQNNVHRKCGTCSLCCHHPSIKENIVCDTIQNAPNLSDTKKEEITSQLFPSNQVDDFVKPPFSPCPHFSGDHSSCEGCTVYENRPQSCSTYLCGWLLFPSVFRKSSSRPDKTKFLTSIGFLELAQENSTEIFRLMCIEIHTEDTQHLQTRQAQKTIQRLIKKFNYPIVIYTPQHDTIPQFFLNADTHLSEILTTHGSQAFPQ